MSLFAKIGTQTVLNFSFGFLVSTWRSGNNSDLCTQMLKDSLEALQCVPNDFLVNISNLPIFWLETLERSSKFLFQVVIGYYKSYLLTPVINQTIYYYMFFLCYLFRNFNTPEKENISVNYIPNIDKQFALSLLLELGLQRKSLSQILQCVLMFFELGSYCDK